MDFTTEQLCSVINAIQSRSDAIERILYTTKDCITVELNADFHGWAYLVSDLEDRSECKLEAVSCNGGLSIRISDKIRSIDLEKFNDMYPGILKEHDVSIKIEPVGILVYTGAPKPPSAVYRITLSRGKRSLSFHMDGYSLHIKGVDYYDTPTKMIAKAIKYRELEHLKEDVVLASIVTKDVQKHVLDFVGEPLLTTLSNAYYTYV